MPHTRTHTPHLAINFQGPCISQESYSCNAKSPKCQTNPKPETLNPICRKWEFQKMKDPNIESPKQSDTYCVDPEVAAASRAGVWARAAALLAALCHEALPKVLCMYTL